MIILNTHSLCRRRFVMSQDFFLLLQKRKGLLLTSSGYISEMLLSIMPCTGQFLRFHPTAELTNSNMNNVEDKTHNAVVNSFAKIECLYITSTSVLTSNDNSLLRNTSF